MIVAMAWLYMSTNALALFFRSRQARDGRSAV
jgi:hypothetical protein